MRTRSRSPRRALRPASRAGWSAVVATFALVLSLLAASPSGASAANRADLSGAPSAGSAIVDAGIVTAAAVVGFDPENIISDTLFYDGNAMTSAEIQTFLDAKIGACRNGKCLNVLTTGISSRDAVYSQSTGNLICAAIQGGSMRVAELIYRVQVACGISAKVILVTLQKEQGLTTSKEPSDWNLTAAMGASCPDTAPCDPAFAGVGPQILKGTQQLKTYKAANFAKQPGINWIGYSPNSACGGTNLNIRNYATAALYSYTPYQPNAAALAAGYGLGDGCSSYGNRNFYNYYTDWFGSTGNGRTCDPPASTSIASASGLYVTNTGVNARIAPSTVCDNGVQTVAQNTLVARVGTYEDWAQVRLDGVVWWIRADLLTPLGSTPAPVLALDENRHLFALASDGSILAYPFSRVGRWGDAIQLSKASSLTQIVEIGDLDADGHRDLIGIDAGKQPALLRGDGTSFVSSTPLGISWAEQRLITGGGDFDGDGVGDVLTVDVSGILSLWRGESVGGFAPPLAIGHGWSGMTAITGGGDFTGDGNPDLLARDAAGRLYLYAGDGSGGWKSGAQIGVGWSAMTTLVSVGDFTGDGRDDLVARDGSGALHLYSGTGSALAYVAQIGVGWGGMRAITGAGPAKSNVPRGPISPGAGDLNGDRKPDVAALSSGGLLLYAGDGAGGWLGTSTLDASWVASDRIVPLGDFTGDGIRDLGRIRADGTFVLSPGAKGGGLAASRQIGTGWGGLTEIFGAIDFDGDGNGDVIARDASGRLLLYRGDGRGGWIDGGTVIGNGWSTFDRIFAAGDFDGDGKSDVLARTAGGDLWLYPTSGASGWRTPRQIGVGWSSFTSVFSPGNFDGAGGPDVLARTAAGALFLYRGDGKGGWSGGGQIGVGWSGMLQIQ